MQNTTGLETIEERLEDIELSTKMTTVIHGDIAKFWKCDYSIAEWKLETLAPVPKTGNFLTRINGDQSVC